MEQGEAHNDEGAVREILVNTEPSFPLSRIMNYQ